MMLVVCFYDIVCKNFCSNIQSLCQKFALKYLGGVCLVVLVVPVRVNVNKWLVIYAKEKEGD